jgi:hypothetical protein
MPFAPCNNMSRLILIGSAFLLYFASAVFAAQNKVDICHVNGQGKFKLITIAGSAYAAHIAHGDKPVELFFRDADGDGFGSASEVITACDVPAGYVEDDTDCDDASAAVYPGAPEIGGNDIIEDCNIQLRTGTCPCAERQVGGARWAEGFWSGGQCEAIRSGLRVAAGVATGESIRAALASFAADSANNLFPRCAISDERASEFFELRITEQQAIACVQSLRVLAANAGVQCP